MTNLLMYQDPLLLILDLEATCDERETQAISGANRETVEIGAVLLDIATGREVDHFSSLVRPVVNPTLTPFCRKLLGIKQSDLDGAEVFPAVAQAFMSWAASGNITAWASWGEFDRYQWGHDTSRHNLNPELPWPHLNLKKLFGKAMSMRRRGIGGAYTELGLDIGDERHRGLADARLIARLVREAPAFHDYIYELLRQGAPSGAFRAQER